MADRAGTEAACKLEIRKADEGKDTEDTVSLSRITVPQYGASIAIAKMQASGGDQFYIKTYITRRNHSSLIICVRKPEPARPGWLVT
jgi:hypothetical protein